jgi:hypothetical protein
MALAAEGELVHLAAGMAVPRTVEDGLSPQPAFVSRAEGALSTLYTAENQPRTLCFSAALHLCVEVRSMRSLRPLRLKTPRHRAWLSKPQEVAASR